jgi:hypothetical protein
MCFGPGLLLGAASGGRCSLAYVSLKRMSAHCQGSPSLGYLPIELDGGSFRCEINATATSADYGMQVLVRCCTIQVSPHRPRSTWWVLARIPCSLLPQCRESSPSASGTIVTPRTPPALRSPHTSLLTSHHLSPFSPAAPRPRWPLIARSSVRYSPPPCSCPLHFQCPGCTLSSLFRYPSITALGTA